MVAIWYFKQVREFTLHNPNTKESAIVYCNYMGFSNTDLFTGIKSIKRLNEGEGNKKTTPISSSLYALSKLGYIFPVIALVSIITGVVFFIDYFQSNITTAILAVGIALITNLVVWILSNYFMQLCIFIMPRRSGWLEAYIDDFGTVSIPDKKTGKTIPVTMVVDGKKTTYLVDQKEFDKTSNAFFGKGGFFEKKKE